MTEKRDVPRVRHSGFCILSREDSTEVETWECKIINISAQGALIECPDNWPGSKNDNVRMTLVLKGSDIAIKMSGIIARQNPSVLAVEFLTLNMDSLAHLESIIGLDLAKADLLNTRAQKIANS